MAALCNTGSRNAFQHLRHVFGIITASRPVAFPNMAIVSTCTCARNPMYFAIYGSYVLEMPFDTQHFRHFRQFQGSCNVPVYSSPIAKWTVSCFACPVVFPNMAIVSELYSYLYMCTHPYNYNVFAVAVEHVWCGVFQKARTVSLS